VRERPLISVVVPVYNAEKYLRASLDSILGQTYSNVEFLVMDDASTDGSATILREYKARDPRVRIRRAAENRGPFGTINAGITCARGEFLAIHHADDIYDPRILELEVEALRMRPKAGAVFCADVFIDEDGAEFGRLVLPPEIAAASLLDYRLVLNGFLRHQNAFIRCSSGMFRKSVFDAAGPFDDSYDLRADLEMWLRLTRRAPIAILPEHLVSYRFGHDNESRRYEHLRTEPEIFFTIVDRELAAGGSEVAEPDAIRAYEGHRAEDLLLTSLNAYIAGEIPKARALLGSVDPRSIARTAQIDRVRLLLLFVLAYLLVRLPRVPLVSALLYHRWHGRGLERKRKKRASKVMRNSERTLPT
jgi:glycosyltransferase involved in cell wall biosynthesis